MYMLSFQARLDVKMSRKLSGDKLLKANRRNNIASAHLGFQLDDYDREMRLTTKYIDQEKKTLKVSFDTVKRTTGTSEEGRKSRGDTRRNSSISTDNANLQLSERRLSQWRVCEKQLKKIISLSYFESKTHDHGRKSVMRTSNHNEPVNASTRVNSASGDDVFNANCPKQSASRESYRDDVFITHGSNGCTDNSDSENEEEANQPPSKIRLRPQTTKSRLLARQFSRKVQLRPTSAYPVKQIHSENMARGKSLKRIPFVEGSSLNGKDRIDNDQTKRRNVVSDSNGNFSIDEIDIISQFNGSPREIALPSAKTDRRETDVGGSAESRDFLTSNPNKWEFLRRQRPFSEDPAMRLAQIRESANTPVGSRERPTTSITRRTSAMSAGPRGRPARVSWAENSEDETEQLNWRELVNAKSGSQVLTKMASVGKVLQAAMAFSKTSRQKALEKMVEKKSTDRHELIRQERLRRLQTRTSLLQGLANQWHSHNGDVIINTKLVVGESKSSGDS